MTVNPHRLPAPLVYTEEVTSDIDTTGFDFGPTFSPATTILLIELTTTTVETTGSVKKVRLTSSPSSFQPPDWATSVLGTVMAVWTNPGGSTVTPPSGNWRFHLAAVTNTQNEWRGTLKIVYLPSSDL